MPNEWGATTGPSAALLSHDDAARLRGRIYRLTAENASLRDQLARETALRIAAEQRAEAMAW